jgi:superfamily II DNA/RNA helicase
MRERDASVPVVVATDVWATGIDIPSLRAVYNAGGGQAPIGLRQRGGRALRRDGEKTFKFYDVVDRTEESSFSEHAARRMDHYGRAGFKVSDRDLMRNLLDRGERRGRRKSGRRGPGGGGMARPERPDPGLINLLSRVFFDPFCVIIMLVLGFFLFSSSC